MLRKWLPLLAVPAGIVLLLAGCGGKQNPVRLDTGGDSSFFNGVWDGFTVLVVFVIDITHRRDYQYYNHTAPNIYFFGYIVGVTILVLVVSAILNRLWLRIF